MRAIILAAGKGERLFPLTRNTPKSLLDLGGGVTVLEHQIENIREAGIKDIVIVAGYKAEQIEAKIASIDDVDLTVVYNPFYDSSNNLVSAWFAREFMRDNFVLINGDDVFEAEILVKLLTSQRPITMVIDRKEHYDDDDMKVMIEDEMITSVSKMIDVENANGESIGVFLFQGQGCGMFRKTLDRMVRYRHYRKVFYLAAVQKIIDEGFPVYFSECLPEQWAEIDFHPDLEFIRENFQRFSDIMGSWGRPE